jgi:hypothetical protein
MTPGEVKGLQAIAMAHGGSLTTNPQTGLPEAGFLSSILPMIAGIALAPATGGASLGITQAWQTAALVGGLTGLATGSLKKGLLAGLGAYGGAGIGDVVGNAGTAAIEAGATGAATAPVAPAVPPSPVSGAGMTPSVYDFNIASEIASAPTGVTVGGPMSSALPQGTPLSSFPTAYPAGTLGSGTFDPTGGGLLNTGGGAANPIQYADVGIPTAPNATPMPTAAAAPSPTRTLLPDVPNQMDIASDKAAALREAGPMGRFTRGIEEIGKDPSKLLNSGNLKYGAAALGSMMFQEPENAQVPRDTEQYRYAYNPNRDMPPTRMGDVGEYRYFNPSYTRLAADGGIMSAMPVQRMSDANNAEMLALNRSQMYAKGGISHLGDYSDGGRLLRGPGDGVSDSIPASIANKRPARLADGEFVVPARIVSELGNGSTDAGARKLYAMMNRVQKNRGKTVGKNKVAVDSRSEKLLPA